LADLAAPLSVPVPELRSAHVLAAVTCLAAIGAFARDSAEHATTGGAAVTAGIEAVAVIGCYLVFGRTLGLWREAQPRRPARFHGRP
jgi:hypothetical protein